MVHDPRNLPLVTTEAINVRPNTEASIGLDMTNITRAQHPHTTNCTQSWDRTSLRDFVKVEWWGNYKICLHYELVYVHTVHRILM